MPHVHLLRVKVHRNLPELISLQQGYRLHLLPKWRFANKPPTPPGTP